MNLLLFLGLSRIIYDSIFIINQKKNNQKNDSSVNTNNNTNNNTAQEQDIHILNTDLNQNNDNEKNEKTDLISGCFEVLGYVVLFFLGLIILFFIIAGYMDRNCC